MFKTVVDTSVWSYKSEDDFLKPFMDEPLADEEWLARYRQREEENKKLESELKKRLENCVPVKEW